MTDYVQGGSKELNSSLKTYPVGVSCTALLLRSDENSLDFTDPNMVNGTKEQHLVETITEPSFWVSLHRPEVDPVRAKMLQYKTCYERGLTAIFQQILKGRQPMGRVIDVGMNIGWFTLLSRSLGPEVLSFEPNPVNSLRTCEFMALNNWTGYDGSITIYPYALGDVEATMQLGLHGTNPGASTLASHGELFRQLSVPVKRLDDIVTSLGWLGKEEDVLPIYVMKVDVEGYDPFVLAGSQQLIQSGLVENILIEIFPKLFSDPEVQMLRFVSDLLDAQYDLVSVAGWSGRTDKDRTNQVLRAGGNRTAFVSELINVSNTFKCNNHWWRKTNITITKH